MPRARCRRHRARSRAGPQPRRGAGRRPRWGRRSAPPSAAVATPVNSAAVKSAAAGRPFSTPPTSVAACGPPWASRTSGSLVCARSRRATPRQGLPSLCRRLLRLGRDPGVGTSVGDVEFGVGFRSVSASVPTASAPPRESPSEIFCRCVLGVLRTLAATVPGAVRSARPPRCSAGTNCGRSSSRPRPRLRRPAGSRAPP